MTYTTKLFIILSTIISISPSNLHSQEIIIIKSSEIIPYQKALEGFKSKFSKANFRECSINEDITGGKSIVERSLKDGGDLVLAIGPEAAYLIGNTSSSLPKLFTMVANPEKLLPSTALYPGVSLNLPVRLQLERIKLGFPKKKNIGILYTPELNQTLVDTITASSSSTDLRIVTFPIQSQKDVPLVLNAPHFAVDILWIIPDRTIGSEKMLKFLIKEMLLKKIPVVGFNEWFTENGALLSFAVDYYSIGVQTAERAQRLLSDNNALSPLIEEPSSVVTLVNLKVAKKLGIPISPELTTIACEVIK